MTLPFIFANAAAGKQPAANLDTNFNAVALNTVIPCTASGVNAITLTPNALPPNQAPVIGSYINRTMFSFEATGTTTGPVTMRVGALAFLPAYRFDGTSALGSGDISPGLYLAVYSSALTAGAGGFYVLGGGVGGSAPATLLPLMDGVATVGVGVKYAREDHVHPADTSRAPLVSPGLIGTPTAPTAGLGTNTTQVATTQYVMAAVAAGGGGGGVPEAPSDGQYYSRRNAAWAVASTAFSAPTGVRLSYSPTASVMTTSFVGFTSIYCLPHLTSLIPIWDGSQWVVMDVGSSGISQALTDTTKSPAATVANGLYDLFAWFDGATPRLSRGAAWTNPSTRATTLVRQNGVWVNTGAITNGPAAGRGTWLGTFLASATNTADWKLGGSGSGGAPIEFSLWNAYNRVDVAGTNRDLTASWTYSSATWRVANASVSNSAKVVLGASDDCVDVTYMCSTASAATSPSRPYVGIGVDSTTVNSGVSTVGDSPVSGTVSQFGAAISRLVAPSAPGSHTYYALEQSFDSAAIFFYGGPFSQPTSGLILKSKF